jgi:hypothetical protein
MVRTSREVRCFTLRQAQQALPLVRLIVGDVVELHLSNSQQQSRIDVLLARRKDAGRDVYDDELHEMSRSLDEDRRHLKRYVAELEQLGVELLDLGAGCVAFPAMYRGRIVRLLWQLRDSEIHRWQELDDSPEVVHEIGPERFELADQ